MPRQAYNDLQGKRFGKLLVLEFAGSNGQRGLWKCQCDCGIIKDFPRSDLVRKVKPRGSCGCLKKTYFHDLTGLKFNKLTLLEYVGKSKHKTFLYKIRCDCGKIFQAEGNDVKSEKIKTCGCGRYQKIVDNADYEKSVRRMVYTDYRNKANRNDRVFDLDVEFFIELTKQKCYYCNVEPMNMKTVSIKNKTDKQYYSTFYNGIDRMDNNIGYTKDNAVPCCKTCNQAKHTMTVNAFKEWFERVFKAKEDKQGSWS